MTELEGAIITEIAHCGNDTAFKVRQSFKGSLSSEWSGSAGAVYPAVRRLIAVGYVKASPVSDGRGTQHLHVTEKGHAAHKAWMNDAASAVSIGADPFRLRTRLWLSLPKREKDAAAARLSKALDESLDQLRAFECPVDDPMAQIGVDLAIRLQESRLGWLKKHLGVRTGN